MAPKKPKKGVSKVVTPKKSKKKINNQQMTVSQELQDLMDTNLETPVKKIKSKVQSVKTPLKSPKHSKVKTPLKSPKQTSKGQPRQRAASFRFTDDQKLELLAWYDSHEILHMDSSDYKKSKRTGMYSEKGKDYQDEEGNVCEPEKLFNFLKRCRKNFTNMTKGFDLSGPGQLDTSKLDPVSKAIYTVYSKQGRSIVRKNRGLKSKTVST